MNAAVQETLEELMFLKYTYYVVDKLMPAMLLSNVMPVNTE